MVATVYGGGNTHIVPAGVRERNTIEAQLARLGGTGPNAGGARTAGVAESKPKQ